MGFLDWLHLGWAWMLSKIGGYTGLVAYFLLALLSTLTVAHVARFVRRWLDARKPASTLSADERLALVWLRDHADVESPMVEPVYSEGETRE